MPRRRPVSLAGPVRVLLVDRHDLFRDALRLFLEAGGRCFVVGSVSEPGSALEVAASEHPEVAVLDADRGDGGTVNLAARLRELDAELTIILLGGRRGDYDAHLREGLVQAHLPKDES